MSRRHACRWFAALSPALPAFGDAAAARELQTAGPGVSVRPERAARCEWVAGRLRLTSPWVELTGGTRTPPDRYAFDAYESDEFGRPTDDADAGCTSRNSPPGLRWHFGFTYNNPFWSNDLRTDAAGAGRECEAVQVCWLWNLDEVAGDFDDSNGDGLLDHDCYMAIFTSETNDPQTCTDNGSTSEFPGVIYHFPDLNENFDGLRYYVFATLDLSGTGLSHRMPADGAGGVLVMYGSAYDPGTEVLTLTAGFGDIWAQPMLWGTDEDEPSGGTTRVGTQDFGQYDDDAPSDGMHNLLFECYDYRFGVCPDPLCGSIAFLYKSDESCACTGDANGDGVIDVGDLSELLAVFGTSCPCPTPCVDANEDESIDISDLALLLSRIGGACP